MIASDVDYPEILVRVLQPQNRLLDDVAGGSFSLLVASIAI